MNLRWRESVKYLLGVIPVWNVVFKKLERYIEREIEKNKQYEPRMFMQFWHRPNHCKYWDSSSNKMCAWSYLPLYVPYWHVLTSASQMSYLNNYIVRFGIEKPVSFPQWFLFHKLKRTVSFVVSYLCSTHGRFPSHIITPVLPTPTDGQCYDKSEHIAIAVTSTDSA